MTFELVRAGWPNTTAILALAFMPIISLAMPATQPPEVLSVESIDHGTQTATLTIAPHVAE